MKKQLKVFDALCATEVFKINGKKADTDDFGDSEDRNPDEAEPYGCGDQHFTPRPATQAVLDKYGITVAEYNAIAQELESKLSFGSCGWCV